MSESQKSINDPVVDGPVVIDGPVVNDQTVADPADDDHVSGISAGLAEMFVSTKAEKLEQESDEGNVEYKLKLIDPSEERFVRLTSQLKLNMTHSAVS